MCIIIFLKYFIYSKKYILLQQKSKCTNNRIIPYHNQTYAVSNLLLNKIQTKKVTPTIASCEG